MPTILFPYMFSRCLNMNTIIKKYYLQGNKYKKIAWERAHRPDAVCM